MARLSSGSGKGRGSSYMGGRRWTWVGSAIVVGILVVIGVFVLIPKGGTNTAGGGGGGTSTTAPKPSATSHGSGCDVPAGSQAIPKAAPSDVKWAAAYGNSWPTSEAAGPTVVKGQVGTCFAHSPTGAAFAAVNILQTSRVLDNDQVKKVLRTQYVQNQGLNATETVAQQKLFPVAPADRAWGREIGFNVQSYTPERATITLVENYPQRGQLTGNNVTVVWQDGDWKIELQPDGQTSTTGDFQVTQGSYVSWDEGE